MQVPLAIADHERDIVGPEAANTTRGHGAGGEPGCFGGRSDESAFETGGAAESAGEPGAAEECEVSGAGGQDHRTAAQRAAADQRHAEDDRDAAAVWRFRMLSDDVSAGVSEWRCF